MANVRDADLAKTIGRNITRSRGPKSQVSEPTVRFRVNLRVNSLFNADSTQILRWRVVGEYYASS